jgi:hypothetical protein
MGTRVLFFLSEPILAENRHHTIRLALLDLFKPTHGIWHKSAVCGLNRPAPSLGKLGVPSI